MLTDGLGLPGGDFAVYPFRLEFTVHHVERNLFLTHRRFQIMSNAIRVLKKYFKYFHLMYCFIKSYFGVRDILRMNRSHLIPLSYKTQRKKKCQAILFYFCFSEPVMEM